MQVPEPPPPVLAGIAPIDLTNRQLLGRIYRGAVREVRRADGPATAMDEAEADRYCRGVDLVQDSVTVRAVAGAGIAAEVLAALQGPHGVITGVQNQLIQLNRSMVRAQNGGVSNPEDEIVEMPAVVAIPDAPPFPTTLDELCAVSSVDLTELLRAQGLNMQGSVAEKRQRFARCIGVRRSVLGGN